MRGNILIDSLEENGATPKRGVYSWLHGILENNKPKTTIAALDGVRAIACLSVVMFHIGLNVHIWDTATLGHNAISIIMAGDAGVSLFFVLSGFLLFLPYIKSLLFDGDWPSLRTFYLRRALRIMPGYYLSLLLMIIIWHPEYLQADHLKRLFLFLIFFMDSSKSTFQQINGPFWTLAVEWQFYLLLPLLAFAMRPIVQRGSLQRRVWMLVLCLVGLASWGMLSRYAGLYLVAHTSTTWFVPRQVLNVALIFLYGASQPGLHGKFLEDFALGMLAAFCYMMVRNTAVEGKWNCMLRRLSPWLWGFGLLWLFEMALWEAGRAAPHPGGRFNTFLFGMGYDVFHEIGLSLGFAACVVAILFGSIGLKRIFEWTPLRWVGLISYSMYMWHLPLIYAFIAVVTPYVQTWRPWMTFSLYWLWVLVAVIPFSFLFFALVERPWMRVSDNLRQKNQKKVHSNISLAPPVDVPLLSSKK